MLNRLAQGFLVSAFTWLVFETAMDDAIDVTWVLGLEPALVAFGAVVERSYLWFVQSIAFRNVVVVVIFKGSSFARQFFAAFPIIAIDDKDVLDVEIVAVDLISVLFILFVKILFYEFELLLWVDEVDGPLCFFLAFFDCSQFLFELGLWVECFHGVVLF
jgi:hypothetical protein